MPYRIKYKIMHLMQSHQLWKDYGCGSQTFGPIPRQRGFFQLLGQECTKAASRPARRTAAGTGRACSPPRSVSKEEEGQKRSEHFTNQDMINCSKNV